MNRVVLRANIAIADEVNLELPIRSRLLHVAPCRRLPNTQIDLWYDTIVGAEDRTRMHTVRCVGTGRKFDADALYIGTVVCPNDLVWHVYLDAATTAVPR